MGKPIELKVYPPRENNKNNKEDELKTKMRKLYEDSLKDTHKEIHLKETRRK